MHVHSFLPRKTAAMAAVRPPTTTKERQIAKIATLPSLVRYVPTRPTATSYTMLAKSEVANATPAQMRRSFAASTHMAPPASAEMKTAAERYGHVDVATNRAASARVSPTRDAEGSSFYARNTPGAFFVRVHMFLAVIEAVPSDSKSSYKASRARNLGPLRLDNYQKQMHAHEGCVLKAPEMFRVWNDEPSASLVGETLADAARFVAMST